ncbi:hypothetical protein QJ857_gp0143 [Tupanvirus soda lake]|uniref:Uncharacterized protein n=2 Tax=Tupanvirus TaxID=2094720 RepID=A0A6N1P4I9_9VIRU|nr:hypothetical protein QJ857_gp0143 [Tupanvirus soda lake]QKU35881.1 hypothetical protein [Tupanvirus soda lake]
MLPYQLLLKHLKSQHLYPVSIKPNYCVIMAPGMNYHITIFQEQWDDYEKVSGKPYYLFHISSNDENNRCSSYFWVTKYTNRVKKIPRKYFLYNQPNYTFFSSTRNPCHLWDVKPLLKIFQSILDTIE